VGTAKFEARIKELVENLPDLILLVEPLLVVRRVLREQLELLHRRLLAVVRDDAVCRRLMTLDPNRPIREADSCTAAICYSTSRSAGYPMAKLILTAPARSSYRSRLIYSNTEA